jgi:hypothetical protein
VEGFATSQHGPWIGHIESSPLVRDSCAVASIDIRLPQDWSLGKNRLNQEGVTVDRRLSPLLLIPMMKMACEQRASFHESPDQFCSRSFHRQVGRRRSIVTLVRYCPRIDRTLASTTANPAGSIPGRSLRAAGGLATAAHRRTPQFQTAGSWAVLAALGLFGWWFVLLLLLSEDPHDLLHRILLLLLGLLLSLGWVLRTAKQIL